ncbi:MAG: glycosyltransferase family 2 protein [bacterium]
MQQKYPLVSINLLVYNGEKYIKDCLDSVLSQTYPFLEILIIDNASTDNSKDYFEKLSGRPKIKVIFNKKNIGFSAGHNQGIKHSKGDLVLCLNQDLILDKDFIQNAVKIFNKEVNVGAVQGKLIRLDTINSTYPKIDTTGLVILKNRRIISRGQGQFDHGQFENIQEIFGADGAAPIYSRVALEDIKIAFSDKEEYFDEDFFLYKEDVDLAWRLRLYGWRTFYQSDSLAWHDRTAGDSAAINYFNIIKERLKISKFPKYLSFKNQRLMQIKNEQGLVLAKHLFWFLPKEIASWLYVLIFERYTYKAIKDLFKQIPMAWQKRKIIMSRKRVSAKQAVKWFV